MSKNDRIINNINATMSMEDMPLLKEDKERLRECLEGKVSYEDAINKLIENPEYADELGRKAALIGQKASSEVIFNEWKEYVVGIVHVITRMTDNEQLLGGYWFLKSLFVGSIVGYIVIKNIKSRLFGGDCLKTHSSQNVS